MNAVARKALMSSARSDWQTPRGLLSLVKRVSRTGRIEVDPAATRGNTTQARRYYALPGKDGLKLSWSPGLAYCNPPYGYALSLWTAKAVVEARDGAEIIMLLPARTDTKWWHRDVATADAVCFWRGRVVFRGADHGAPFPSALAYWGDRAKVFRRVLQPHGWIP